MIRLIPLLISALLLSKCSGNDNDKSQDKSCEGIMCTQEFRTLTVTVKDSAGEAVMLDSYTVTDLKADEQLSFEQSASDPGSYVLYSDKYANDHQNTERSLVFEGMKDGAVVVSETYEVAADCCHIQLLEGDLSLTINE